MIWDSVPTSEPSAPGYTTRLQLELDFVGSYKKAGKRRFIQENPAADGVGCEGSREMQKLARGGSVR